MKLLKAIVAGVIALASGARAETCNIEKRAELTLGYQNGLATVDANIAGTPVVLGIDTGAHTLVSVEAANQLGLYAGFRRYLLRGTTASVSAGQVILRDFEFAGQHYKWKLVAKADLPTPKVSGLQVPVPLAGLVGIDILADYDLDFDFPNRKLTLYSVKGCSSVPPPDFTDVRTIAFRFGADRLILFPVELDGHELTAILDTGAVFHAITREGLRKVGLTEAALKTDPMTETVGVGNIGAKSPLHKFTALGIAGVEHKDVRFGLLERPLSQGDALIGQQYLFTRRIRISPAAHKLFIENKSGSVLPALPASSYRVRETTLEDVCKGKAALRLDDFCDKGTNVPAAALVKSLPLPSPAATAPLDPWLHAFNASPATLPRSMPASPPLPWAAAAPPASAGPGWRDQDMFAYGSIGTAVIGLYSHCAAAMGFPYVSGVLVRGFATGSTGEIAGLKRGDFISALDGSPIASAEAFLESVRKVSPGQKLKLAVWRDKAETVLEAEAVDLRAQPQDKLSHQERATYQIEGDEAILALLPGDSCRQERAVSLVFLGGAYGQRAADTGAADRERAIVYLAQGLAELDRAKFQAIWATAQTQLGNSYRLRTAGGKGENIERAIRAYEESILAGDAYVSRDGRAAAMMGLGLASLSRSQGKRSDNIERAIDALEYATKAFDSKVSSKDWARLHRALATAYIERTNGQRQRNLDAAIAALEVAANSSLGDAKETNAIMMRLGDLKAKRLLLPAAK